MSTPNSHPTEQSHYVADLTPHPHSTGQEIFPVGMSPHEFPQGHPLHIPLGQSPTCAANQKPSTGHTASQTPATAQFRPVLYTPSPLGNGTANQSECDPQLAPSKSNQPFSSGYVAPSSTGSLTPMMSFEPGATPAEPAKKPRKKRAPRKKAPTQPLENAPPPETVPSITHPKETIIDPTDPTQRPKRHRVDAETLDKICGEPLDQLRARAVKYAEYERLTAEDKLALDEAYREYQTQVHLIAIERKLHPKPVLQYLGNEVRIRGPSNFNNFCVYDQVAGPIYHDKTMSISDRMSECARLWHLLDKTTQNQWRDQDFLDSISPPDNIAPPAQDGAEAVAQWKKRDKFKLTLWIRKIKRDLKNLSVSHQVEGFFVLASRDPDSPIIKTGGSLMAEEFLDLMAANTNPCSLFYRFVNGQQAIKDISGSYPKPNNKRKRRSGKDDGENCPHDLGSKKANIEAVREKLKGALRQATHGVWQGGWPGTKTESTLASLGVTLQVQQNDKCVLPNDFCARPSDMRNAQAQCILTAFAEGWVRLLGPPPPEVGVGMIGHEIDDDDSDASPTRVTITAAKRPKVTKKQQAKKRASAAGDETRPTPEPEPIKQKRAVAEKKSLSTQSVGIIRQPRSVTPPDSQSPTPSIDRLANSEDETDVSEFVPRKRGRILIESDEDSDDW
ncbi:uncharacterized protein PGTG_06577 [Puccinia graminis f. sp. tritici CRL 75-36-700-3]|uniref:Uncharacterized protein n=1 Tax=Puccinia graminis f. sp. tritici (strain CRL 75-36-700-3 / race SCCL) TaxID=418459 RepID=E3K8P0_PUCGT|nr:uncharacterized protein PGTG_06577 [Puccinia graminis f. sp. tritici CRL 75-36-700-3]EFP80621.1 hypothetical protein PGTG_06577 [Puccinia graminis f. sp. tritici CRL 75-36-700-3]